ncbi:SMP-30/gluconolactonase/LRE family protein [Candidatus Latescibacterota bacterium]
MNKSFWRGRILIMFATTLMTLFVLILFSAGCSKEPEWKALNDKVIQEQNVQVRTRDDIPETGVAPSLEPGKVYKKAELPDVEIAPGVTGKMYWGKGVLVNWMTLEPNAVFPREKLPAERIMVVWSGSVDQLINGDFITMKAFRKTTNWTNTPHKDFLFLEEGTDNEVIAGAEGAEILEIYWPVRADYVEKAGGEMPAAPTRGNFPSSYNFEPNVVYNFYDVQFTNFSEERTANSRMIWGTGAQCSFLSVDPGRISPYHNHPEEQLMIVLGGYIDETIMDTSTRLEAGDIAYLPGDMVHRGVYGTQGCDILDVFWPPRPDFIEKTEDRLRQYHAIIPENAKVELVHNGEIDEPYLNFSEGPAWMDGILYFSNMWFAADWSAGNPKQSNTIRVDENGSLRIISRNMQTNGIMPLGNGNLAVCDMFGHRLIEMNTSGRVIRTLASQWNGVALDGPNDIVIDAKGGIYITDPQFTPGLEKTQPGKAVYYRKPNGDVILVVKHGEMGQPNGILLSPDGKTCYIANTRNMPVGNWVAAYDVNDDGSLSNQRLFAKLHMMPEDRYAESVTSGADGMTIDVHGNIYVASNMGLQIFAPNGDYIGLVNVPIRPVSAVFGGDDMQTIYMTCATHLYKIRTNVKGLMYPLK